MDVTQRDRLLTIIDNDSEIQNAYIEYPTDADQRAKINPQYCILGGIMVDMGIDVEALTLLPDIKCFELNGAFISDLTCAPEIAAEFGLTLEDLVSLQAINDDVAFKNRIVRQEELKALVHLIYGGG